MIYVLSTQTSSASPSNELLSVDKNDLGLCPEKAQSADFLQTMDGWF